MNKVLMGVAALLILGGCAKPVRYRTAGHWTTPPEGKPTLYQTYLEGQCSAGFAGIGQGCSDSNSKLKRCTLNDDNTLVCVEDVEANKMLNKDIPEGR
jgi:hypothetical protein